MLFIKDLREEDSGTYRCSGIYATNEEMHAQVDISTFSKFLENSTWQGDQASSREAVTFFGIMS